MYRIAREPIDAAELTAPMRSTSFGALAVFEGLVRSRAADGREVTGLSYEAHETMACTEFERIAVEAQERFACGAIRVVHRLGDLAAGEVAVIVAVAAEHRAAAFDACRFVVDELKARVPIWKKERYRDGHSEWIANAGPPAASAR